MGFHWLTLTAAMLGVNGMDGGQEGRQGVPARGCERGQGSDPCSREAPFLVYIVGRAEQTCWGGWV